MLARSVGLALRREIDTVFVLPAAKLRRAKLSGVPLTLLVTAVTGLLWVLERTGTGTAVVTKLVDVYSALPLGTTLQRLPGSLFAPAPDLPVVGALVQVVIVFGVAELTIGRWRSLTVALLAQAAATASADLMVWLGPQTVLGVDQSVAFVRDTGPSVAVAALSVYVCLVCRARILLLLVVGAMFIEVGLKPDLAGREHIVAVVCGLLFAVLFPFVTRLRRGSLGLNRVIRRDPRDWHQGRPLPASVPKLTCGLLLPCHAARRRLRPPARTARGTSWPVAQTLSSPVRKASAGRQRLVVLPDRGFGALSAVSYSVNNTRCYRRLDRKRGQLPLRAIGGSRAMRNPVRQSDVRTGRPRQRPIVPQRTVTPASGPTPHRKGGNTWAKGFG